MQRHLRDRAHTLRNDRYVLRSWVDYVNVGGKVQKTHSFSIEDIKQMAKESNHIVCSCGSGNAVAQIEVTGIPVSLLVEMAEIDMDVNTITVKSADGYGIAMPLSYVLEHEALLVYQINGQDIPAEEGSLQLFMEKMSQDDILRKSAQQDGQQIFINSVFSKVYDKTAMDSYKESREVFGMLFSDPKKYAALKNALAEIMYRSFRQN